ncbi:MAG: Gfo/Idh/MocA family oxidoreductase [Pirellulaceae bacterium]|nr:Gfo/Idh/MocA family oxidoreductase [Pirellulaceae bacterium]
MERLKTAVIGTGHLGKIHLKLLADQPQSEIVGIYDVCDDLRDTLAKEYNVSSFCELDLLIDQIDAAIVAAPTANHFEIGAKLLNAGKHLFLEKPITQTVEEGRKLVALAQEKKLVLQVGHVERFNPAFETALPHLREIAFLETSRTAPYTFRSNDVGIVLDLMIHDLDLVLTAIPEELTNVTAQGVTVFGPHEDIAHAQLTFAGGASVQLTASRCSPQPTRTFCATTANGQVNINFAEKTTTLLRAGSSLATGKIDVFNISSEEKEEVKTNLFTRYLPVENLNVRSNNAIAEEHTDFLEAITKNGQPRVDGKAGLRAIEVAYEILDKMVVTSWQNGLPLHRKAG